MKFIGILASVASLAGIALAQIPGLPDCAQHCVSIPAECQTTDFQCICSDRNFITDISCCIANSCNAADQQIVITFAKNLCGSYSVAVPTVATCPATGVPALAPVTASNGSVFTVTATTTTTSTVISTAGAGSWIPELGKAAGFAGAVAGAMALI